MVYDNAASAQSWTLENGSYWMPNLDVTSTNEKCETCGHVYDPEEGHTCTFKCEYCGEEVTDMEAHYKRSLSCGNAAGGGENDEDGADEEPCGITGNMNDGYNIPNVTVIGNRSSNSGLWSIEIYCGGGTFSYGNSNSTEEINTEEKLHEPQQGNSASSNTVDNHRCPCMITANALRLQTSIDNNPLLNSFDDLFPELTNALKRHIAFPETIQQGNNGTCGPATIQKWLAENYPEQYIECVCSLAMYGKYEPWGLKICYGTGDSPYGMPQDQLNSENANPLSLNYWNNGYASVDALMQSAIQTWTNGNTFLKRVLNFWAIKEEGYDPRKDDGEAGGMTYTDISRFITEEVAGNSAIVADNKSKVITYDYLNNMLLNEIGNDLDSYTVLASVNTARNQNGPYFGNGNLNHIIEVSGLDSGKIKFWSWGNNQETSVNNCQVGEVLILKKTYYAKNEKIRRQQLSCGCSHCTNLKCDVCMP